MKNQSFNLLTVGLWLSLTRWRRKEGSGLLKYLSGLPTTAFDLVQGERKKSSVIKDL